MKPIQKLSLIVMIVFSAAVASQVAAQTATVAHKPAGWETYKPAAGHFSIDLPAKPVVDLQEMNSLSPQMKAAYYTSMAKGMVVVVGDLYNLPTKAGGFSDAEKRSIYENFRNGLLSGIKSSLAASGVKLDVNMTEPKDTERSGLSGFEQELSIGTFKGRARMLVAGDRLFMFCAIALESDASVAASLDSFVYNGKKKL